MGLAMSSCAVAGLAVEGAGPGVPALTEIAAAAERTARAKTPAMGIKADVAFLADDALRGREAGTPGFDAAADYVVRRFAALGLEPGGDLLAQGGRDWFQAVPMRAVRRITDKAVISVRSANGDDVMLAPLEDYLIGRSMVESAFELTAPAVFAGFGVTAPEENYDDYAGLDVSGKIVFVFTGAPANFDGGKRAFYASGDYKRKTAEQHGAIGFVTLPTHGAEKRQPWARAIAGHHKTAMTWIGPDGQADVSAPGVKATAALSMAGAKRIFSLAGEKYDPQPVMINDGTVERTKRVVLPLTVSLGGETEFSQLTSSNVVGVIEGGDRDLKGQVIVLSAHLDHVGYRTPDNSNGDGVYNGALDNAMGVAALLDAARAFRAGAPPKRTIVFLATTAEEKGLIGADYFARHPSLDGKEIVANINLDMALTLFPFIDVVAFGAERSSLGKIVDDAAASMGVAVIPDPIPEYGIFSRSDHYRFVEQGIPAIYLFVGFGNGGEAVFRDFMKSHYHQPSDDISLPIDYAAAARFARLNYLVAFSAANQPDPPQWVEGDFFGELFAGDN